MVDRRGASARMFKEMDSVGPEAGSGACVGENSPSGCLNFQLCLLEGSVHQVREDKKKEAASGVR